MRMGILLGSALRRRFLGASALFRATEHGTGPHRSRDLASSPDAALITAAVEFCSLEHRMQALVEGPGSPTDDQEREALLRPLRIEQAPHLDRLCQERARTPAGHQARAAAFVVWDAGELDVLATASRMTANRLLAALVRDLVGADG